MGAEGIYKSFPWQELSEFAEPALTIHVPPDLERRVHQETSLNNHEIFSKEARVNGLRIFYRVACTGRPLLLLHGSPLTSRSWLGVMTSLAQEYTVVAPDFRGYGKSDKPATGYQVQTMVEDIRQLVHQLGMGPVDVVGHDLGGIVAYVYAAKCMQEVSRLGIIESPIGGVPSPTMQRVLASYWHIVFYAHPRLPELLITGRERDYLAEFIETYAYQKHAFTSEDLDEYAGHLAVQGGLRGALGVYRAIGAEIPELVQFTQRKLTMPVWAVGGDHSMNTGPVEQFRNLAERVTGGVIENCGHWVAEEQPNRLLAELRAFLGEGR